MEMWMQYTCLYSKHVSIDISTLEKRKSPGLRGPNPPHCKPADSWPSRKIKQLFCTVIRNQLQGTYFLIRGGAGTKQLIVLTLCNLF